MRSLAGKPPVHMPEYRVADYDCLNVKLKTYYARKRKLYEDTYPDFYDADLRQLFSAPAGIKASVVSATAASAIIECRLPMDEREKVSGEPASCPADAPLRPAWASRAQ